MKTFIVDSSNSLFATSKPFPANFKRLNIETNILAILEAEVSDAYCIVYPSFSRLLANSFLETGQVANAQSDLLAAMEQIVYFYKLNRKCCTLLYLAEQNLTVKGIDQLGVLKELLSQISRKQSDVPEFIAASSLLAHKEFSTRLVEFESCSCGDITFELQVDAQQCIDSVFALQNENEHKLADAVTKAEATNAALSQVQQARNYEKKAAQKLQTETQLQLQELEQENYQIFDQLHKVQELFEEKLEQLTQTEQKLADAVTKAEATNAALSQEQQARNSEKKAAQKLLTETQHQLKELEQENNQIFDQLHKVQELFEEKLEQLTQTEQKLVDKRAALAKEQQARIYEQKASQKLQTETQRQLQELYQENKQIIEQLLHVQEQIEQECKNKERHQKLFKAVSQDRSAVLKKLEKSRLVQTWLRSALTKANHHLWSKSRTFRNEMKRQAKVLKDSSEFVESQYLEMYPDIKTSSLEPVVHYLLFGAIEARNPSTTFSSLNYIQTYADVAESGQNPLLHYIRHGQFEGRKPNPMQLRLPAPKG